jgi:hypothetical protein
MLLRTETIGVSGKIMFAILRDLALREFENNLEQANAPVKRRSDLKKDPVVSQKFINTRLPRTKGEQTSSA